MIEDWYHRGNFPATKEARIENVFVVDFEAKRTNSAGHLFNNIAGPSVFAISRSFMIY